MNNAKNHMCEMLYMPKDNAYSEDIRRFQGCPTIAVTPGGRIFMGWYSGGSREPHIENYNLVIYSDDEGYSWSDPILVIPSNKEKLIQALDIQLWISPQGKLFVFWVQNNVEKMFGETDRYSVEGYIFDDKIHAEWVSICDNPDAEPPVFSRGRYWGNGFLRCKPLCMSNGEWLLFNYDQTNNRYGYSISHDQGKTFKHYYGAVKQDVFFDESMAYEKENGSIRMLARCKKGKIAEATSKDYARTWTESSLSNIVAPDTRLYVARTPSGRILLVNNDHAKNRTNMTIQLSEDDGVTWKYKRCIDTRESLSYPDVDFFNGKIYLTYDRERFGENSAKEILLVTFTEEHIIDHSIELEIRVVNKPRQ